MIYVSKSWSKTFVNGYNHTTDNYQGVYQDTMEDSRDPIRKSPKGSGWRPPLGYARWGEHDTHCTSLTVAAKQESWWGQSVENFSGADDCSGYWYTQLPQFPASLQAACEIKARLKLKNEGVNIATNLGERAQTASLVASTCKRLHDGVVAARRLDPRGIQKALGLTRRQIRKGSPFDMWLEAQYGWKPMLQDVHAAVSQLSDREHGDFPPIVTVKSGRTERDLFYREMSGSSSWGPLVETWLKKRHEVEHKCFVRLDFTPDNGMLQTAAQLGLTNPAELAWELLPFSFVADWFIPVGDYLSQLDATLGYAFKGGSITKKTTMKTRCESVRVVPIGSYPQEITGHAYPLGTEGRQFTFSRTIYSSAPLPLPWLSLKDKSSGQHAANGIALLASAFTKKVKGRFWTT